MTSPLDVPPFQVQTLIPSILDDYGSTSIQVNCAQALGSEIYVGCSDGELRRYALQADDPTKPETYSLLSRQTVVTGKPVVEMAILPCISRVLVLSDHQVHFYTLPSLDPVPYNVISPIRHVVTFAVDYYSLQKPPVHHTSSLLQNTETVEFCIIKRAAICLYSLRDRLTYRKEIPLPGGASVARRIGKTLCLADKENYNIVDMESAEMFAVMPISQSMDPTPFIVTPSIVTITENEFLILSWTGASTIGVFLTPSGDPTRGTLEWPSYPDSVCYDYPYIISLLPDNTVEVHNIDTQAKAQVIPEPPDHQEFGPVRRSRLIQCLGGYLVPSTQQSTKMRKVPVPLRRAPVMS